MINPLIKIIVPIILAIILIGGIIYTITYFAKPIVDLEKEGKEATNDGKQLFDDTISYLEGCKETKLDNPKDVQYKDINGKWYVCKYPWTEIQGSQDSNSPLKCRAIIPTMKDFSRNLAGTSPYKASDNPIYTNNDFKLTSNDKDISDDPGANVFYSCPINTSRTAYGITTDKACKYEKCSDVYPNSFQGSSVWGTDKVNNCYKCSSGYSKNDLGTDFNKVCVSNCPSGYSSKSATECYKCASGFTWDPITGKCVKYVNVPGSGAVITDIANPSIVTRTRKAPTLIGNLFRKAKLYNMFKPSQERKCIR